ncbi:S8 family serine peptidase [Brevibacillus brevis]|uniref:S8 family serine peptidase n=1 Tax=Brevibacillus brevis TaxID=1393 RepID=UPI0019023B54|nr:S8 family serine peptidase [Brevibacillus brevis]
MSRVHIVTFKTHDHGENMLKLTRHIEKSKAKLSLLGNSKTPEVVHELKELPRTFIIKNADENLLKELRNNPDILSVDVPATYQLVSAPQSTEWSHSSSFMDIQAFHSRGYKGAGVKVGYLDTGAAPHEDLVYAGKFNAYTAVYGGTLPPDADMDGHGTKVAGIIGARNNNNGYVGVAPECLLYGVKVVSSEAPGDKFDDAAIVRGIHWLIENGVQIINCSFISYWGDSSQLRIAMEDAYRRNNVLFLCGAGNGREKFSDPNNTVEYPAKYDFVMAVSALRANKEPAKYSSRGPEVDIAAPGDPVMTTSPSSANKAGTDYNTPSAEYTSFTGTSCATPHIAGLAALYKQMHPNYTAAQIRNLIETNVEDLGKDGPDDDYGKGLAISPWTVPVNYRGKLTSTAISINGTSISETLTNGLGKFFKFIPVTSGRYTIVVSSSMDLYGRLYDGNYNQLLQDDDSAGNGNPKMVADLVAGQTYYIKVSGYSGSQSGSFTINISNSGQVILEDFEDDVFTIPFTGDWSRESLAGNKSAGYFSNYISHNQTSQTSFKATVPAGKTAKLSFDYRTSTESNDRFIVTVNNTEILNTSGSISYTTFETTLNAGTNVITFKYVRDASGDGGGNNVSIDNVAIIGDGATVGEAGSSSPGDSFATAIIVSGTTASGNLQDTKDLYFKYAVPKTGNYTFTTSASFDSYMQLLDSSQNTLAQDDDSAGNSQPKITYTLSEGQVVYLKVYGYNHGAGKYGSVTLNIAPPSSGSAPGTPSLTVGYPTTTSLTLNYFESGATSYDIYRNGVRILAGTTQTSYQDSGLSANTTYSYFVIATNSYGTANSASVYGTTSPSSGGVTPTTIFEDFEDSNMNFTFSGDWTRETRGYQSTYAYVSTVPAVGASSSTQFTVSVPPGATTAQLKFNARCDSSKNATPLCDLQVFVNSSLKLTLPANAMNWYVDQVVALGTGNQTIKFQWNRNNNNTSYLKQAIIDSVEVKWS